MGTAKNRDSCRDTKSLGCIYQQPSVGKRHQLETKPKDKPRSRRRPTASKIGRPIPLERNRNAVQRKLGVRNFRPTRRSLPSLSFDVLRTEKFFRLASTSPAWFLAAYPTVRISASRFYRDGNQSFLHSGQLERLTNRWKERLPSRCSNRI